MRQALLIDLDLRLPGPILRVLAVDETFDEGGCPGVGFVPAISPVFAN